MATDQIKLLDTAYSTFINIMLADFPLKELGNVATNDVMGYGTAIDEKIQNIQELKNLAVLQKEQSANLNFTFTTTPVFKKIMDNDTTAIIVDEIQITMHIKSEKVELQLRLSTVMNFIDDAWKVVHWHGSKPEYDSDGTDTWHKDEWKEKQAELEKQVQEKTAELITKNRELEIEAAVERVQVRTMAMAKSDELREVVSIIYQGLEYLGIDISFCLILIYDEKSKDMEWWSSGQGIEVLPQSYHIPVSTDIEKNALIKRYFSDIQEGIEYSEFELKDKTKKEWDEYIFNHSDLKQLPNQVKHGMIKTNRVILCDAFMSCGTLEISMQRSLSEDEIFILKRFAKVVDLTFTRVRDLQKAEEQAREAQIESALERVRSRTMTIQNSADLNQVVDVIFIELKKLGFDLYDSNIAIYDKESKNLTFWGSEMGEQKLPDSIVVPPFGHPYLEKIYSLIESGVKYHETELSGKLLKSYQEGLIKETEYKNTPKEYLELMLSVERIFIADAFMRHGFIEIAGDKPLSFEMAEILQRFAKVVDYTYTRFDDLVQAETLAREAQIEAAMERIRSRTMGMQKSDELAELNATILQQVKNLNVTLFAAGIHICDPNKPFTETWIGDPVEGQMPKTIIDHSEDPLCDRMYRGWKDKKDFIIDEMEGEALNEHFLNMAKYIPDQKMYEEFVTPDRLFYHLTYFSYGFFVFTTVKPCPEDHDIFKRFAKVFEQTYTRFLDLQNAEAQAREAQIETALERIRARSMAMHKSDELQEVIAVVFEQLFKLGIKTDASLICILENSKDLNLRIATADNTYSTLVHLPYFDNPIFNDLLASRKKDDILIELIYNQKEKNKFFNHLFLNSDLKHIPDERKRLVLEGNGYNFTTITFNYTALYVSKYVNEPYSKEEHDIFIRFGRVFEQTYTRFLDLQKAEEQAREAQIETALERIRNRTLLMKYSFELNEAVAVFFDEFQTLKLLPTEARTYFCDINTTTHTAEVWMTGSDGKVMNGSHFTPLTKSASLKKYYNAWKNKTPILERIYTDKKLSDYLDFVSSLPHVKKDKNYKKLFKSPPKKLIMTDANFLQGNIGIMTFEKLSEEALEILKRFAKVFEFTYTRFLDLQNAEAQAREAKIETALERIRASSMAMHKSDELQNVIDLVFMQLVRLGIKTDASMIIEKQEANKDLNMWIATPDEEYAQKVHVAYFNHPIFDNVYKTENEGKELFCDTLTCEVKNDFYKRAFQESDLKYMSEERKRNIMNSKGFARSLVVYQNSYVCLLNYNGIPFSDEANQILIRVAKVFEQSYTRFLDLKKAEAQAREAQIEASLERIRTQAMAMQHSDDLIKSTTILFEELEKLDLSIERSGIGIFDKESRECELWTMVVTDDGKTEITTGIQSMTVHPLLTNTFDAWVAQESYSYILEGKDLIDYYNFVSEGEFHIPQEAIDKSASLQKEYYFYNAFGAGGLYVFSDTDPSDSEKQILRRFAEVFHMTYTRFEDLQKAEAQTREAQVEVALERIRAQAMAMQNSSDLEKSALILFDEFEKLNLSVSRCGIGILDKKTGDVDLRTTVMNKKGEKELALGTMSLFSHPMLQETYNAWLKQETHSYILEGDELVDYYKAVAKSGFNLPKDIIKKAATMPRQYFYNALFGAGGIYVFSETEPSEYEKQIIYRFAEVFHLTYTRYEDLQKAEARALDAIKQASLDRVRGEIASMRSTEDLNRITPLIWHELNALEVPIIRCGVLIMNDETELVQMHLSAPDGTALGIFELPYHSEYLAKDALKHWKAKSIFKEHWNKEQFLRFMANLLKLGKIKDTQTYTASATPPESLYLNFVPFKQGMLYVGNVSPLDENALELVKSLAETFSIAYARYEDFKLLEEAKNKVEHTLSELKSAQTQLIHSEKMASLGELTAGIAHEIQNPLNFVNNFSEISSELMEEMDEELHSGDIEEVKAITTDIKQNLDKINHHGKRASSIVKGMLQHSRTSSGQKEFTNINELADEYLRLSYHGLRAKDKSFNADFKTEFDESLPKLNIISQDIGRVLLNLINNAFYAVNKKANENIDGYKPIVTVSTRSSSSRSVDGVLKAQGVEIKVTDNGSGIPSDLKDKIFQPFFTTKPTGAGTGLGLSLSYDIVKAHGGEIKVESIEDEGTSFTIII